MAEIDLIPSSVADTRAPGRAIALPPPGSSGPDAFHKQGGPDVRVSALGASVAMFAVFTVNPETDEVQVAVFDDRGLVRVIPPASVFQMVAMMRSYRP